MELRPISLRAVSQFAFSLATCLGSGLLPGQALTLSAATAQSRALQRAATRAAAGCEQGMPISDALEASGQRFPHFFLPVIRAGELGGRVIEACQLIHEHGQRLGPSLKLVRQTWLYPLIIILTGWAARIAIFLTFGLEERAWLLIRDTAVSGLGTLLGGWLLYKTRPIRSAVDWLLLQLPVVRETLLRLNLVLFFSTFRLVYEAGGLGVTRMLDLSLRTISNSVIRRDLAKAGPVLAEGGSFEDAFGSCTLLDDSIQGALATGAISGHLGKSLAQITQAETLALTTTLEVFNRVFQRLMGYSVAMAVAGTLLFCLSYGR